MLARFRVLLPFVISVRYGDNLASYGFDRDGYHIRVFAPYKTALDPSHFDGATLAQSAEGLRPAAPQTPTDSIRMDSAATVQANALQIDFTKEAFDRAKREGQRQVTEADPPIPLAFSAANDLLKRVRSVGRAAVIRLLTPCSTTWHLHYLTDEEGELPEDSALVRGLGGKRLSIRLAGLNETVWNEAQALPSGFEPPPWESLLFDAEALLPEIGPSIAVVYAALEVFIARVLDQLDRAGHYEKEPSVADRFDVLLKVLAGRSLKEEAGLWQSFRNVQNARHSFIHEGVPTLGGRPVTEADAYSLVGQAKAIIDWVEALLPAELQRSHPAVATFQIISPLT